MRVVAAIATACLLLGSGCSAIVDKPTAASVVADVGLGVASALVVNNQICERTGPDDRCYVGGAAMVAFGVPAAVISVFTGVYALDRDRAAAKAGQ